MHVTYKILDILRHLRNLGTKHFPLDFLSILEKKSVKRV